MHDDAYTESFKFNGVLNVKHNKPTLLSNKDIDFTGWRNLISMIHVCTRYIFYDLYRLWHD